jgi:CBS domain-containing protein
MSVKHILAQKGRNIEAIGPDTKLAQAILHLASKRIGALLVIDAANSILGILSERDIVRAIAADPASLNRPVGDFMTSHVITCGLHTSIPELMDEMTMGRFRHLPVVVGGSLAGLVSIGDVVKYRVAEIEAESRAMRDYIATA